MKTLVEHRFFQRGILTAILINTLSMSVEYHNQVLQTLSQSLTNSLTWWFNKKYLSFIILYVNDITFWHKLNMIIKKNTRVHELVHKCHQIL